LNPHWKPHYHPCGVIALSAKSDPQTRYVQGAYELNKELLGEGVCECREEGEMKQLYPEKVKSLTGQFRGDWGYKNKSGGWAASRDAVVSTNSLARQLGVRYLVGEASHLTFNDSSLDRDVTGVILNDGRSIKADFVISAMGAWTPLLLPELKENCLPTGQTVAVIQLTKEEQEIYKTVPVSLCMDTGFYCFPPTDTGLLKFGTELKPNLPSTFLSFITRLFHPSLE